MRDGGSHVIRARCGTPPRIGPLDPKSLCSFNDPMGDTDPELRPGCVNSARLMNGFDENTRNPGLEGVLRLVTVSQSFL